MFVFEAHTITRPYFPIVITRLIDPVSYHIARHAPYLPYQAIVVARKIAVSMFIAVAQIAPQFRRAAAARESPEAQAQQVGHLLGAIDNDAKRLLELEIVPYVNDTELEARLKGQLKTWLVQNEIRNDPGVDAAIRRVLDRRRMGEEDLE
jgi:hypothetical protein